ncbi:MAG TPA: stage II sporulation protein D [Bacillales bacterium]|nr:stage II sporulation protein D [Bacillales bacterium]
MEVKSYLIIASFIVAFVLILPAAIVIPFSDAKKQAVPANQTKQISVPETPLLTVSVYRSHEKKVESVPLEQYLVGVVASEMPATFEMEALKAQALASRTYLVNYLLQSPDFNMPEGAEVTDTVMHQVYQDSRQLKKEWGSDYDWKIAKIKKAVQATKGEIITYNGQPIDALFFSASNGYTENSEAYWLHAIPYLKSVPSPWDRNSPKFLSHTAMSVEKVNKALGVQISKSGPIGEIIETTPGHRVGKIEIAGKTFTGRDVREKLGLRSTDFSMKRKGDRILITTKGWGHGVGMSQYGANGMAKEGNRYKDIVKYYYQGVSISALEPYTAKLTAKK